MHQPPDSQTNGSVKRRLVFAVLFVVWSLFLVKILVLKDIGMIRIGSLILNLGGTQEGPSNWVPFKTIWPFIKGERGWLISGLNIAGNIGLLVPFGFLGSLAAQRTTWMFSTVLALSAGLALEGSQLLLRVGIFDIDDVILNGLGVIIGVSMMRLVIRYAN